MEDQDQIVAKKPSFFKRAFKFVFIVLIAVLLLVGSLLALLFYYEEEVKAIVIKELNKSLNAEVKVDPEHINLTILKTFPDCSIEFTDILMLEALKIKRRDTLMFASKLNLYFNVKDIWNKRYNIQKIRIKDGLINLLVLKDGRVNYEFWKSAETNEPGTEPDSLSFSLNSITIEKTRFRYKDKQLLFKSELQIKHLQLKGSFNETSYELEMKGETFVKQISKEQQHYLKDKYCDFELAFDVNQNLYTITKARILLNRLALEASGKVVYGDSLELAKIEFNAPGMDISSLLSLLPQSFKEKINDYKSDGNFFAKGSFNYWGFNKYELLAKFGVKNAEVTYLPNSTQVNHLNLDGTFSLNQTKSQLDLKHIRLNIGNDEISGDCSIDDFSKPFIKLHADANIHLENLVKFYPIDTISQLSGRLNIKSDVEGLVSDLKSNSFGTNVTLNIAANVDSLKILFKGDEKLFTLQSCSVTAIDREVEVKNCKLLRGSSDILVSGRVPGLFNYLSDRTLPLTIIGDLYSENIKLEDFMRKYYSSESKDAPIIPANVIFQLNASIQNFSYSNFKAEKITGDIEIRNQKAIVNDVKLKAMQGDAEINAFFDNSKNRLDVVLQSKLNNINITELYRQFNNFGQSTLIDKNLKGFATAKIDLRGTWSNALDVDYNSIQSNCDLTIERGELIDFKPLLSLSKFVDVKDLQHIRFLKLQSMVEISNQIITLPKTTINNSAMNIDFWGSHSFDNDINYHIQLRISDLLSKRRQNKDSEFGLVEDDPENRRSAFILMTGTVDNPIIKYDKKGLKEKIKGDIKAEKQNIKQLLKEEFGLFKKDTLLRKKTAPETKFELEKPVKTPAKKPLEPKKKEEDEDDF